MTSQRVALFDPDDGGAIRQMLEGASEHVLASAAELDLGALPVSPEITGGDFGQLDRTHRVIGGELVEL